MRKSIGNNIGKNVSSKYVQKLLDHAMMHLKLFQKQQLKTVEATGDLIGN